MGNFVFTKTKIEGVYIIENKIQGKIFKRDKGGYF